MGSNAHDNLSHSINQIISFNKSTKNLFKLCRVKQRSTVSMQRLQLLQKERHQKSIQLYWAEKSGTTRIQAKKYYRKAKLQEISRKSQNPIIEKKQEFWFNQTSGTAILASMYIKNPLRVKSRKRQDLILAVLLSRSQISF